MSGKRTWAATVAILAAAAGIALAATVQPVLVVGDPVGEALVADIGGYALGADGTLASRDQLSGTGAGQAILTQTSGSPTLVVAAGDPAAGGGTLQMLGALAVDVAGGIVFRADVTDGSTTRSEIFAIPRGGSQMRLVGTGDPTPMGDGSTFTMVDEPAVAAPTLVVFRGQDSAGRQGIFRLQSGALAAVALAGDPMPGGGTFVSFGGPSLGENGTVAFFASGVSRKGIFAESVGGTLRAVASVGDTGPGGVFTSMQAPAVGSDGVIAFRGALRTASDTSAGIFAATGDVVALVATQGGTGPSGGNYTGFGDPTVGAGGKVAFRATLTAPSEAIVVVDDHALTVVETGQPSPLGALYTGFGEPLLNGQDRLVFRAALNDASVTEALLSVPIGSSSGKQEITVDCDGGQLIRGALAEIADGGLIKVKGTCHENVVVAGPGGVRIEGMRSGRRGRHLPTLVAADPTRPALDVQKNTQPSTVTNLAFQGGAPAIRVAGTGHALRGLRLAGGGIALAGEGHTVDDVRITGAEGPCLTVGAAGSRITKAIVRRCRGDGIVVTASGVALEKVSAVRGLGRGAVIESDLNSLLRNRLLANQSTGLLLHGTGNTLRGNRVVGNRGGGIIATACNVDAGGNRAAGNSGGPNRILPACTALSSHACDPAIARIESRG